MSRVIAPVQGDLRHRKLQAIILAIGGTLTKLSDRFLNMHVNQLSALLALAPAPSGAQSGGQPANPLTGMIVPLVLMAVIFFFVAIRPQQQRAKQQAKLLAALKPGDKVVTSAGIIGTVTSVKEKSVALRSGDAKFEVTKGSVTEIIPEESAGAAS